MGLLYFFLTDSFISMYVRWLLSLWSS